MVCRYPNYICAPPACVKSSITYQAIRDIFKPVSLSNHINSKIMKYLAIIMMLFSGINLFGQVRNFNDIPKDILNHLDKMGVDGSQLLNSYESAFLNVIFKDSLKGFDFTNKKVGFIKISGGKGKIHYFDMQKKYFVDEKHPCDNGTLYIFNATQKEESGGYDAGIVYWSKRLIPIQDVVKRLK